MWLWDTEATPRPYLWLSGYHMGGEIVAAGFSPTSAVAQAPASWLLLLRITCDDQSMPYLHRKPSKMPHSPIQRIIKTEYWDRDGGGWNIR